MIRIKVQAKGDFKKTKGLLANARLREINRRLNYYGELGVQALKDATPRRTGKTAESWYYTIKQYNDTGSFVITWCNSNVNNEWANIAILLDTGHATRTGGYVQGRNYLDPAICPVFDTIAKDAWEEVTRYAKN